ncbi:hypothetical protein [Mucilaginibacter sp. UYCu711]|uniref:hypothetical protein n=1 Tax=Mucilaginibacter sp. UYCu711 TaxID=3156339 RepID=UPI003D1B0EE8
MIKICLTTLCLLFIIELKAQNTPTKWVNDQSFCLSDDNFVNIWGGGKKIPGAFFDEYLPAFFERKLAFKTFDLKGSTFQWILTGNNGGITLTIDKDSIELVQRYYDSFGFNKMQNQKISAGPYPQSKFSSFKISVTGKNINSVSLAITHNLSLKLYINDVLSNEQITQIDVSRHQLQIIGSKAGVCGELQTPATSHVEISVNSAKKYQEILGFGGITTPTAFNLLSNQGKSQWWDLLKKYNLLLQREYPVGQRLKPDFSNWDNLKDAVPHYYGDNFPNGEASDFAYNKKIQQMGGEVIFEFWQLPTWMVSKEGGKNTVVYDKYAAAIVNYCKTARVKTGKAPLIVGIQNEVTQAAEVWQEMTKHLRKALDDNNFKDVKIHMHNASNFNAGIKALKAFSSNDTTWRKIDYTASNLYDYQEYFTNPDGFDMLTKSWNNLLKSPLEKKFLSTEICINRPQYQSGSYRVAFLMGELYHKNIVDLNATALMYCWLLVNNVQPSYTASRSLFTIDESRNNTPKASSFQLRVFGAFSKNLLKGFQRVKISSSDQDLLISAYAKGKKNVVIILNRGTNSKEIKLTDLPEVTTMEIASPYLENTKQALKQNNKSLQIEPGSIVTLF